MKGTTMTTLFAERVRTLRDRKGLTQGQLAAIIGVAANTVSQWERGERLPLDEILPLLAEALDTSMWYLIGGPDDKESEFLPDKDADAIAEAEEQEIFDRTVELLKQLNPYNQKVARAMIGTLWRMQRDAGISEDQGTEDQNQEDTDSGEALETT